MRFRLYIISVKSRDIDTTQDADTLITYYRDRDRDRKKEREGHDESAYVHQ